MMPRLGLCVLACIVGWAGQVAQCAENPDVTDLDQAARVLGLQARFNEQLRVYCGKQFPEVKGRFDFLVMAWRDANQVELNGLQAYLPTVNRKEFDAKVDAVLAKRVAGLKDADTPAEYTAVCEGFAESLAGPRTLASQAPKAASFLRNFSSEHPLPALELRKAAARTVCIKKGMNQHIDLDVLQPRCACSTQRAFEMLSADELRELEGVVQAFGEVDELPSMKRIAPQLADCQK
jgi:hypothetical protein